MKKLKPKGRPWGRFGLCLRQGEKRGNRISAAVHTPIPLPVFIMVEKWMDIIHRAPGAGYPEDLDAMNLMGGRFLHF